MDEFGFVVEHKFHIVDETQKQTRALIMEIGVVILNEFRARQARNGRL